MPSTLDTLIARVADTQLRAELSVAAALATKTTDYGLVFEDHIPETVRLPHHAVRRGTKATSRTSTDKSVFEVLAIDGDTASATLVREPDGAFVSPAAQREIVEMSVADLEVVAEFGDAIYPGLIPLWSVGAEDGAPPQIVIKGENHHALEALEFTHTHKVDCIYIDPPYNTGARDWKYDNDYVDSEDRYRHSKWLAFMARRLALAKKLLRPDDSVLIVAIDDHEIHRLGLLLQQMFRGWKIQLVTSIVNPRGKFREGEFSRCEDYIFFVSTGAARVGGEPDKDFAPGSSIGWRTLRRSDLTSKRGTKKGGTQQFYPIYVEDETGRIAELGEPLPPDVDRHEAPSRSGCTAVFPVRADGTEMNWGLTPASLRALLDEGFVNVGRHTPGAPQHYTVSYLTSGRVEDIRSGKAEVVGYDDSGAVMAEYVTSKIRMPLSTWVRPSHNAEIGGTNLVKSLLGDKRFPYPKSLYAVEDAIRFFVKDKPDAVILDYFGGSGTTTHAVVRLNREDGGRRQSILITNNEVSADEESKLRESGFAPGDPEWERLGIFEHVTVPRITSAMTGKTPGGQLIEGSYKFGGKFPIVDGLPGRVEFFELSYLDEARVELDLAFESIAPLLWLRSGGRGPLIETRSTRKGGGAGFTWADRHGVLFEVDQWRQFIDSAPATAVSAFIVTDSVSHFAQIASELPTRIRDTVRLYESYLTTFIINERVDS